MGELHLFNGLNNLSRLSAISSLFERGVGFDLSCQLRAIFLILKIDPSGGEIIYNHLSLKIAV